MLELSLWLGLVCVVGLTEVIGIEKKLEITRRGFNPDKKGGLKGKFVLERELECKPGNVCKSQIIQTGQRWLGERQIAIVGLKPWDRVKKVKYRPSPLAGSPITLT